MRLLTGSDRVRSRYAELLKSCTTASVYQTPEWLRVWEDLGADLAFVEADADTMVPFVCKGRGALRRAYSLPFDTYGGPVTSRPNGPVSFEDAVRPLGIDSVRVADFAAGMRSSNGALREVRSHIVGLTGGYDVAAARYTEANLRLVRQAGERGVRVTESNDAAGVREFHRLHVKTVARYGARPLPRAFFDAVLARLAPADLATFYLAHHDGRAIAGNLVLRYREHACDWMWVYDERFLDLRPTNLMIDRAIRDEAARGSRRLNLGASPNERLGSVRFKQSFGATPFTYAVYAHTGRLVAAARTIRARMTRAGARIRVPAPS